SQIEGGCTQDALQRLGRPPREVCERLRDDVRRSRPAASAPSLTRGALSERVRRILQAASEEAAAAGAVLIEERHLLEGFLREADGPTVESLRRQGVDLDRLRAILRGEPEPTGGSVAVAPPSPSEAGKEIAFAADARQALSFALQEACRLGSPLIETPHLVIGLTKVPRGWTAAALEQQGFDPKRVRDVIRAGLRPAGPPRRAPTVIGRELLSPRVQTIVGAAAEEAAAAGQAAIGERHLLSAFLRTEGSATAEFLRQMGIDLQEIAASLRSSPEGAPQASPTPLLNRLGRDLTRLAREGQLKPVIGRRREMARIAQVLARTDKNTPLLIGDAGVGKTAVVEGLAQRIAEGKVPPHLQGRRIVEVQVASLVAGTKYRGELEERLAQLLREASQPDVILFLDEIHTLVGAGRGEGTTLDASNIFKPALARGEIRCIGATTLTEFRKTIEKDAALERRFQRIMVEEPSPAETLEILRQTRSRYESHHGVRLLDEALEAAVRLSLAYLPDRHLPDKACDLVDEACVRLRVGSASQWPSQEADKAAEPPAVDADAVARVVAEWTGIPVGRLTEPEQERLLRLEELLRERVVGQEEAISAVAQAVRLARAGLKRPGRPVGVFLFAGPTGVGKTELAKALAEVLFGSQEELIRLDMSEYMEAHSVSRLVGAPPGYVGYDEGGQLTGALRRKPYAVVLMDEIEKAHQNIFDLFLQLFDDGRLTDAQGRLADGRNAIFILTCNVASELVGRPRLG
ncbi:MAG: ATP-dependent Clp protease ATP-binding subunit, partial [Anaerolineae bacterium]|nr:ATP-dependent Clp protease ATP-binding subunit [Anaerolineae bacterium]